MSKPLKAASILLRFPQIVGVFLGEWAVIYSVRISETNSKL